MAFSFRLTIQKIQPLHLASRIVSEDLEIDDYARLLCLSLGPCRRRSYCKASAWSFAFRFSGCISQSSTMRISF
jgi:hypothetical protein